MTINTKFSINEKVYILVNHHIFEAKIISIDFHYSKDPEYNKLDYGVQFIGTNGHILSVWRNEEEIFHTEDECAEYAINEYKKML